MAHDSAAASLGNFKKELETLGFSQLSILKGRQDYIMQNLEGNIIEQINATSITKTVNVPLGIADDHIYFLRVTYAYEPHIDRYIAHACGEVDGYKSTNSNNALDQNYRRGFRFFELDIIATLDNHLVAAHDRDMWARFTDYTGSLPPTYAQFMEQIIYGNYSTLDMEESIYGLRNTRM